MRHIHLSFDNFLDKNIFIKIMGRFYSALSKSLNNIWITNFRANTPSHNTHTHSLSFSHTHTHTLSLTFTDTQVLKIQKSANGMLRRIE